MIRAVFVLAADSSAGGKYDAPEPNAFDQYRDFGHSHWQNSFIWGENLENISIIGPGIINGKKDYQEMPPHEGQLVIKRSA